VRVCAPVEGAHVKVRPSAVFETGSQSAKVRLKPLKTALSPKARSHWHLQKPCEERRVVGSGLAESSEDDKVLKFKKKLKT
jgi:hypothetical protein